MISKTKLREALANMMRGAGLCPDFEINYFELPSLEAFGRFFNAAVRECDWMETAELPSVAYAGFLDKPSEIFMWFESKRSRAAAKQGD